MAGKQAALTLKIGIGDNQATRRVKALTATLRKESAASVQAMAKEATAANRIALSEERVNTQLNRTLTEQARARKANADAMKSEAQAQATLDRVLGRRRPQQSAFQRAIFSSRFALPGTAGNVMPLVGQVARGGTGAVAGFAAVGAAGAVSQALDQGARAAIDFDAKMRNVNSTARLSEVQFRKLTAEVINLAKDPEVRKGPSDLADGLYDILGSLPATIKGTARQAEALERLRVSAIGASAGLTDTKVASSVLTASLNSGIRGVTSSQQAMDVWFKTVELGKGTFEELASSLPQVIQTAAQLGVSVQEVGAFLATASLNGQSFSDASNDLLNVITKLVRPPKEVEKEFRRLGISYGANALEAKGLAGILDEVIGKTRGNKQELVKLFPDMQAFRGVLSGTADQGKSYAATLQEMKTASTGMGATLQANREQAKSFKAQLENMGKELQVVAVEFGPAFIGTLRALLEAGKPVLGWIKGMADEFNALSKEEQDARLKMFGWTAVGVTVTGALTGMISTIAQAVIAWNNLKGAAEGAKAAQVAAGGVSAGAGVTGAAGGLLPAMGAAVASPVAPVLLGAVVAGGTAYAAGQEVLRLEKEKERQLSLNNKERIEFLRKEIVRLSQLRQRFAGSARARYDKQIQGYQQEMQVIFGVEKTISKRPQPITILPATETTTTRGLPTPGTVLSNGGAIQPPLSEEELAKQLREAEKARNSQQRLQKQQERQAEQIAEKSRQLHELQLEAEKAEADLALERARAARKFKERLLDKATTLEGIEEAKRHVYGSLGEEGLLVMDRNQATRDLAAAPRKGDTAAMRDMRVRLANLQQEKAEGERLAQLITDQVAIEERARELRQSIFETEFARAEELEQSRRFGVESARELRRSVSRELEARLQLAQETGNARDIQIAANALYEQELEEARQELEESKRQGSFDAAAKLVKALAAARTPEDVLAALMGSAAARSASMATTQARYADRASSAEQVLRAGSKSAMDAALRRQQEEDAQARDEVEAAEYRRQKAEEQVQQDREDAARRRQEDLAALEQESEFMLENRRRVKEMLREPYIAMREEIARSIGESIGQFRSFESFLEGMGRSVENIFRNLVTEIITQWARVQTMGGAAAGVPGADGGALLAGASKALPAVGIAVGVNTLLDRALGKRNPFRKVLPKFANGGSAPNSPFIGGEAGPELWLGTNGGMNVLPLPGIYAPQTSGHVISNKELLQLADGFRSLSTGKSGSPVSQPVVNNYVENVYEASDFKLIEQKRTAKLSAQLQMD